MPTEEAIDLINVAFEQKIPSSHPQNKNGKKGKIRMNVAPTKPARNFSVPDRITGISGLEELQCINPSRQWNFIEVTGYDFLLLLKVHLLTGQLFLKSL